MARRPANVTMSARKSAPVRAGGVNMRRLALTQAAREEKQRQEEEEESSNQCGNPFCDALLANRYARFCEDKPMCQHFRALRLQCLANAQTLEDEEDTRPLSLVIKKKKKKKEKKEETFAIPRKKQGTETGKRKLQEEGNRSNSSSPRHNEKKKQKKKTEEDKRNKKKTKKNQEKDVSGQSNGAVAAVSSAQASSASSPDEVDRVKKRTHSKDPRARQTSETSSDVENGSAGGIVEASRAKKRRLNRHVSADDVLSRSASTSPVSAAAAGSTHNWTIPRARPGRAKTAAQAIRTMNVELVPLGVRNQSDLAGGGRYVQNGNRSAAQSLKASDPRARPPSMTKFAPPLVATSSTVPTIRKPSTPSPTASIISKQTTQSTVPTHPPPQTQPPPSLPPLPPQAASLVSSIPRPTERARAVTPSSSPVKAPTSVSQSNSSAHGAVATGATRTRISASDYLKNRQSDQERRPYDPREQQLYRSSSLERSSGGRMSGFPSAPPPMAYPSRLPEYRRSDSAPLPTSSSEYPMSTRMPIDPRRQHPEAETQFRRQRSNDNFGARMEYPERVDGRGDGDLYANGPWENRNVPPPRDRYPPRPRGAEAFGNGGFDYEADTHLSPEFSSVEQPYLRDIPCENPPPPQRAPSPRRNEIERGNKDENVDYAEPDEDMPTFSYHETFLPHLLTIFIHKFPQSLEAVFNVTKKPRKMNWYIKYVERIERLCQPVDLRVMFDGLKAVVTVRGREWLTLQGKSTLTLHLDVIKTLRAEAMTWLRLYEEMEKALAHYRGIYGNNANESYTFLRAWNELKNRGNYISLSRQTNYFCGARLHHWNFVVGKVEIGSGSHEEKREAFRLATVSSLEFLLYIGRGGRRPKTEFKRERITDADRHSVRGEHRSSSRESSSRAHASAATDGSSAGPPTSSVAANFSPPSPSSAEQTSTIESVSNGPPSASLSTAELSSSPVTVDRSKKPMVAIISTSASNGNNEAVEAAEQSDQGEEMSISDTSEVSAATPVSSPPMPPAAVPRATGTSAAYTVPAEEPSHATTLVTDGSSTGTALRLQKTSTTSPATVAPATVAGESATMKDTPTSQSTAKAAIPQRRCMMCEMIRMRKPDGERCLRCQQKDSLASRVLGSSLGH